MRELSERGGGAFYFLEDPAAVQEVFEEEVAAFLIPLATDVVIDVEVDAGYSLRGDLRHEAGDWATDRDPELAARPSRECGRQRGRGVAVAAGRSWPS